MEKKDSNLQLAFSDTLPPTLYPFFAGLYIHIPFCLSKCPYCGFYSTVKRNSVSFFIDALRQEIKLVSQSPPRPIGERDGVRVGLWVFDTIYIGGGTPSTLPLEHLETILKYINKHLNLTNESEITFEVNPGDCDPGYFKNLISLGINRLNLGIQSFDENTLRFLGRRHNANQAQMAIDHARKAGFRNIGLDLIYGVPGQKIESWLETLTAALEFSPEHISCYQLTIEENTPFALQARRGDFSLPNEETQRDFFIRTAEFLENSGYIQYEVSNFAKGEQFFSRHNQKYWNHTPYLGLGPAAHSFDGRNRWWNCRSVDDYMAALAKGNLPIQGREALTHEQLFFEDLFLGLRTISGIHLQTIQEKYSRDLIKENGKIFSEWEKEGLVKLRDGYLRPTRTGLAVADRLALI